MKENKIYCAPSIEVLNARVEKGFAGSGGSDVPPPPIPPDEPVTPPEGGFNAGGNTGWNDGGNLFT